MKYTKIILALFVSVLLTGCDDFLDKVNPNEKTSSSFWKTQDDLEKGINAAYRPLRFNGCYSRWYHVLYVSRSDEGYSTSPNPDFVSYSNFQPRNNDNTEGVFFPWLDTYKGIFWANQVIDNASLIENIDEDLRNRIIGEAYFLRGVHLFNVGGIWGRGAMMLSSFAEADASIVEQDSFYEQARKDFEEAAGRLPDSYTGNNLGRATKGSALGMLVKVLAQQKNWNAVKTTCEEIYTLGYSLVTNYSDNFTEANENNSESLFEVQFAEGMLAGIDLGSQRAKFLGVPVNGGAWDDATASNIVRTDLQKERTTDNKVDPRLKATLAYYDSSSSGERFYGVAWDAGGLNRNKVYWKKYTYSDTHTTETLNNGINFRVVRLADIYLLYAEALNELGKTADAYEWINKVRRRANLPDLENSTVFTGIGNDQAKMRTQIRHERSCELAGESWRWLDLERWGCFESPEEIAWLKSRDYEFDNFVIGKSNRYPIPYQEINNIEGLEQNPGF